MATEYKKEVWAKYRSLAISVYLEGESLGVDKKNSVLKIQKSIYIYIFLCFKTYQVIKDERHRNKFKDQDQKT